MKFINKMLMLLALFIGVSCSQLTDLDINTNPNSPSIENISGETLYNNIQVSFANFFESTFFFTSSSTRMRHMNSFFYRTIYSPETFDGIWINAYSGVLQDIEALEDIQNETPIWGYEFYTSRILQAYTLTTLVDLFGDVPFSEAFQGTDVISPNVDDQASLYATAEGFLLEAIDSLASANITEPSYDNYFDGSAASWISAAKGLLMRMYNNTRLVDASAAGKMQALVDEGDFNVDFQFNWSSNRANPDSRHPQYASDYEADDGGYMANYYMWLLVGEKEEFDPRARYYFYRQASLFTADNVDLNEWDCVVTTTPFDDIPPGQLDHILAIDPNLPFCIASANGYMGRDHGNGQGIPPDGPNRVEWGVYPVGGNYDDNSFAGTQNDGVDGALGQGISPIWLSSFNQFIIAEAAEAGFINGDARAALEAGVRTSIAKVRSFDSRVAASQLNPAFMTSDSLVDAYVAEVMANYDAADDKLDVIMKEYYIAIFGNGIESYNNWRRTGKPNNMQPLIDAGAAADPQFPRTALYPSNFVNRNANVVQRDPSEQVFWDNNPADFVY